MLISTVRLAHLRARLPGFMAYAAAFVCRWLTVMSRRSHSKRKPTGSPARDGDETRRPAPNGVGAGERRRSKSQSTPHMRLPSQKWVDRAPNTAFAFLPLHRSIKYIRDNAVPSKRHEGKFALVVCTYRPKNGKFYSDKSSVDLVWDTKEEAETVESYNALARRLAANAAKHSGSTAQSSTVTLGLPPRAPSERERRLQQFQKQRERRAELAPARVAVKTPGCPSTLRRSILRETNSLTSLQRKKRVRRVCHFIYLCLLSLPPSPLLSLSLSLSLPLSLSVSLSPPLSGRG